MTGAISKPACRTARLNTKLNINFNAEGHAERLFAGLQLVSVLKKFCLLIVFIPWPRHNANKIKINKTWRFWKKFAFVILEKNNYFIGKNIVDFFKVLNLNLITSLMPVLGYLSEPTTIDIKRGEIYFLFFSPRNTYNYTRFPSFFNFVESRIEPDPF